MLRVPGAMMDGGEEELERLRARVRSRTRRILTGGGDLWRRSMSKFRRSPAAGFTDGQYHNWIATCERREVPVWHGGPLLSVVTRDDLTLASLRAQTYNDWEVVDSAAGARGEYVLRPEAGDEFAPDALYVFARAAAQDAGVIYCDEDQLDGRGLRVHPWFKPDWSPDLYAAGNYMGAAVAVRRNLACGSMDDICQRAGEIVHIPHVLYHRRGSNEFTRRRVRYRIPAGTRVEVVIPSRSVGLLARCLRSLREKTTGASYGITIIDNSGGAEIAGLARAQGVRYIDWRRRPFNYSDMNNTAAESSDADLLLFLNDDTTCIEPEWMEAMMEHAVRPEVGSVGARLLFPDGRIQHAGVAIGIFGLCGHLFKGWPADAPTYFGLGETVRNVAAVTGACMMTRAGVFREAGGFDPHRFPVAYNDIDLCLRILQRGYRIIYTPYATLQHHEARSKPWRHRDPSVSEIRAFQDRWKQYIDHDPFYNPNLTRASETFALRGPHEWL